MRESAKGNGGLRPGGIERSIRPGTAVPPTLLVADMGNGAMLLQGWRVGPSAYVCAADAGPLRRALAAAFGSDFVITERTTAAQP